MTRARDLADFNLDGKAVTINESSADLDFRVEGNGNANMLVVDAGNDRIGIGTNTPAHDVEIVATADGSVNDSLQIRNNATSSGTGSRIRFINSTDNTSDTNGASISSVRNGDDNDLVFETENASRVTIDHAGNVGIGTSSPAVEAHIQTASGNPELRIESTGANYATMSVKNSSRHYSTQIRTDQSNAYVVRDETAGANRFFIDTSGNVTMPNQPAFLASPSSNQSDISTGANITVALGTEVYDVGSNFASNIFTAPVTGKYLFVFTLYGSQLDGDANYFELTIVTSNRGYAIINEPSGSEDVYAGGTVVALADMDANDTAYARVAIGSGAATFDITTSSKFSGALIC